MPYAYKTDPWAHQRIALNTSASKKAFALFMGVGTGKTKVVIDTAAYQWSKGWVNMLCVVAPNGVHEQWVDEQVPIHMPDWVRYEAAAFRAGTANTKLTELLQWGRENPDVLIVAAFNIESMSHLSGFDAVRKAMRGNKVLLTLDESHKIKTPSSNRTRNMWKLGKAATARRILTATNVGKGFEDLYSQMMFLDPRILGFNTYTEFKTRHCVVSGLYNDIIGYKNEDELKEKIAHWSFTVERKDCADIKEPLWVNRKVSLTSEQKRLIKDLMLRFATETANGDIIEAEMAIQRLMRVQQIAGGHVSLGGGKWQPVPNNSISSTIDLLEEIPGKVLIWCQWTPDIIQLNAALTRAGVSHVTYYGGNSSGQNLVNKNRFKSDPATKVFLSNPAAGGTGLNLPEADDAIFYSMGENAIDFWQAIGRNDRGMNSPQKTYHVLTRPGTYDAKTQKSLRRKESIADIMKDPTVFKLWLMEAMAELVG